MKMYQFQKTTMVSSLCLMLVACGGTSTSTSTLSPTPVPPEQTVDPVDPDPVPPVIPDPDPIVVSQSLTDASITDPIGVTLLSLDGDRAGLFDTQSGIVTVDGIPYQSAGDGLNDDLSFLRLTADGSVVVLETTGSAPTGNATYTGQAIVRVTDVVNGAVYDGTAIAQVIANIGAGGSSQINYTNFNGTMRKGAAGPVDMTWGEININNVFATSTGLSIGEISAVAGFGDTDFSDNQTTDLVGVFAGTQGAEIGGTVQSTSDGGVLQSTFAVAK